MKPIRSFYKISILFLGLMFFMLSIANATTYYSWGNNAANSTSRWHTNNNNTGSNPANFTNAADIFIIQSGNAYTTGATWTVAGSIQILAGGSLTIGTTNTWTLSIGGTTDISGTLKLRNTSNKIFTGNVIVNNGGTLDIQSTTVNVLASNNVTIALGGTIKHNTDYDNATRLFEIDGNLSIDGTYNYTGNTPAIWMNGTGTKYINTGTTSLYNLFLRLGNFYANGPVTIAQQFYAMWNQVGGSFHTNGQIVNANWGLINNGGTLYVDGGTLTVGTTVGGMLIGRVASQPDGDLQISSGTVNISGGGIYLGTPASTSPKGTCTMTGGTVNVSALNMGKNCTYTQSGGINNVNGDLYLNFSSAIYNQTATSTLNIAGSFNNSGVYNSTGSGIASVNIVGNLTNNNTFTATSTSTVTFNGAGNSAINGTTAATTFNNLIINKSVTSATVTNSSSDKIFNVNNDLTVTSGNLVLQAFDNDYTFINNVIVSTNGTLTHSVAWDTYGKKIGIGGNLTVDGIFNPTVRSHVQLNGSGAHTLQTGNNGASTLSILTLANGDFTASGTLKSSAEAWVMFGTTGSFTTNGQDVTFGALLNNKGTINMNLGGTLTVNGGTQIDFGSGGAMNISAGTVNFNGDLTINSNLGIVTCTNSPQINITGNWTNNGGTFTPASSIVTFEGTSNQSIGGTSSTTFNNLIINPSAGITVTANQNISILNNLTVSTGIYDLQTYTCNRTLSGGAFSLASYALLKVAGGNNFPQIFSTYSLNALSTTEYYGTIAQSVYPTTYGNLTLTNNSTKTAAGIINIAGDLNINTSAIFAGSSYAHTIAGQWYNYVSAVAYTGGTSTFTFNGSVLQNIGGTSPTAFNNLTINNASNVNISQDQTVSSTLTLTSGSLNIGTKNLTFGASSLPVAGSFSASKMIIADGGGEVRKNYASAGLYLFPIGDITGTTEYSPITLTYTSGTFAGGAYSGVKVTNAKHPANASTTDYLNRYWTISNNGITSPSLNVSGSYVLADISGTESSISSAKYTGALPWAKFSVLSANTLIANGISNTGTGIVVSGITNQVPSVSITGGGVSFCLGNSVSLGSTVTNNGTGSITYLWTPATGLSSATISNPVASPTTTTTYILTVTDGNGITGSTNTTITVNALPATPTISAGGPLTFCAGGSVTLTSSAGTTYLWSTGATTASISPTTSGSYTVQVTNAAGCQSAASAATTVTVNALPATPAISAGGPLTFCAGGSVTLTSSAGTTYLWSTGATTASISPTTSGSYTVQVTNAAGCQSAASAATTVTVNALPATPTISAGGPLTFCAGGSVTLTSSAGSTYLWSTSATTASISVTTSGSYTVQVTNAAGCQSAASAATTVTVTPLPSITASNSGPVCVQNFITLSASSISGATYLWSGPLGFTSTAQNPNFVYNLTKAGVYTVVATLGGCQSAPTTTTVSSSSSSGLWTGATNTDWSNTNNWCNGVLPTSSTNVTIPASAVNMPLLTDSRDCNNITVDSGDTLTVGVGGVLNIYGAISTSNKNIKADSGTIKMSGASAQAIPANSFYNNAIKNLVINNSSVSGVSLGGAVDIYGSLTYSGTGKTLNTNDTLTLKSDSAATAWVGDMTGNFIVGKVTVERFISKYKAWRLLSIPTNTDQTIKQAWQESSDSSSVDSIPGYGTQIMSNITNWKANGFDLKSAAPSMKTYVDSTDSWAGIPSTNSTNIANEHGYLLFVRGDRLATGVSSPVTSTTLRTKGSLFTGTLPPLTALPDTYMSVGNPYASAIDFTQITIGNGIDNEFYAFDPFIYGYYGYGGYQVLSAVNGWKPVPGGSPLYDTGSVNTTIQSGEAFFVHATTVAGLLPANYTVTFSENAKISGGDTLISFSGTELGAGAKDEIQSFGVTLYTGSNQSNAVADGNVVVFNNNYVAAVDRYDAKKIVASGENFDLKRNGALLAIEARPDLTVKDTLFYNMSKLAKKTYQLRFAAENLEQTGLTPVLIDQYLNSRTTLSLTGSSVVNITVNSDAKSSAANRFMVVFAPQNALPVTFLNIQAARKDSGILVQWNIENEKNIRNYEIERSIDGTNFNTIGKLASQNKSNYTSLDKAAGSGTYYYRISAVSVDGEIKKSGIAKVGAVERNTVISVFPNPVKDNNIQLKFDSQESANYNIRLMNADGKILFAKAIQHQAGTIIESLKPDMRIAHGIYQLEISKQDGKVVTLQVLF